MLEIKIKYEVTSGVLKILTQPVQEKRENFTKLESGYFRFKLVFATINRFGDF